jgi:hypothetical protein
MLPVTAQGPFLDSQAQLPLTVVKTEQLKAAGFFPPEHY